MLEKYFYEILIGLIFLISFLGTLIFFLAKKLNLQKLAVKEGLKKTKEKERYILESLDIIAKALVQEQCEISEGCIRVRMLIDNSKLLSSEKSEYQVFFKMYEELKNFKTHDVRNSLSKQERMEEDLARFKVEGKYHDKFLESIVVLQQDVKELL